MHLGPFEPQQVSIAFCDDLFLSMEGIRQLRVVHLERWLQIDSCTGTCIIHIRTASSYS